MSPDKFDLKSPGSGGVPVFDDQGVHVGDFSAGGDSPNGCFAVLAVITGFAFLAGIVYVISLVIKVILTGFKHLKERNFFKAFVYLVIPVGISSVICISSTAAIGATGYDSYLKNKESREAADLIEARVVSTQPCSDCWHTNWIIVFEIINNSQSPIFPELIVSDRENTILSGGAGCYGTYQEGNRISGGFQGGFEPRASVIQPGERIQLKCGLNDSPELLYSKGFSLAISVLNKTNGGYLLDHHWAQVRWRRFAY